MLLAAFALDLMHDVPMFQLSERSNLISPYQHIQPPAFNHMYIVLFCTLMPHFTG